MKQAEGIRRRWAATPAGWILLAVLTSGPVSIPVAATPGSPGIKGAGTEGRNWVTGPEVPPVSPDGAYEVTVQYPLRVPMRDGVQLEGRLFLPTRAPTEGPGPASCYRTGTGSTACRCSSRSSRTSPSSVTRA